MRSPLLSLAVLITIGSACSSSIDSASGVDGGLGGDAGTPAEIGSPSETGAGADGDSDPGDDTASTPSSTTSPATTSTTTTSTTTTSTSIAPTTTTEPEPDYYDPDCVVEVEEFDSLGLIASRFDDETVNVVALRAENNLLTADIDVGQIIDVCVGNGLDDVTGEQRTDPDEAIVSAAVRENIEVQQLKLNSLFDDLGTPSLLVDGVSGPVTRQRLCAARVALGFPASTADMAAGSEEERALLAAAELEVPTSSATASTRWVLIDQTCQIMFVGSGDSELTFVFPTSTGSEGFETRSQDRSSAFRYDPALETGGWHDSSEFPVSIDNPLNGNMYKPLYFDGGQAIHGANNVPTSPQSKGCARLRVEHMDALVDWLGLTDAGAPIWSESRLAVTVNVQGDYQG